MRILWMKSDYVLPPDTGGKIRSLNLMRALRGLCDVTYLCFRDPLAPALAESGSTCASEVRTVARAEERKAGPAFYARVLRGMFSRHPYTVQKYRSAEIRTLAREWVDKCRAAGEPAVLLCDFLEMAENVPWDAPCPKVLFEHNVETEIWEHYDRAERNPLKKAYLNFERRRMKRYERSACNRFESVFAVSEDDRRTLRERLGVSRPIEVLPTGVDTDAFAPCPETAPVPGRMVFLGSLDWTPNIDGVLWFLREIYPQIRAREPNASLDVVGRRPAEAVLRAAHAHPGVRVHADVPDVRPHLAQADLFVVPLRMGGGTRIKIYEAMAMEKAVVSTALGAQGLRLRDGVQLAIADPAADFAHAAANLLRDEPRRRALAASGYRFVHDHCRWHHAATALADHCRELVRGA